MSETVLLNTIISSLVLAVTFSLVSLGYVVVFRASRVFNFTNPSFMLVGTLLYTSVFRPNDGGFAVAALISIIILSAIGWLIFAILINRVSGLPHWIQMILTMGLSIVALNVAQLIWGGNPRFVDLGVSGKTFYIRSGVPFTAIDITVMIVGIALSAICFWLLSVSPMSYRLNATAEDPVLASYCGIRLRVWFGAAWAIAAAAATIGGIVYSAQVPVDASLSDVGLLAFPAAMLGGMDSVAGAFIGAVILAFVQQFASTLISTEAATPIAFSIVLLVLLVRPRGLLGSPLVLRV